MLEGLNGPRVRIEGLLGRSNIPGRRRYKDGKKKGRVGRTWANLHQSSFTRTEKRPKVPWLT
jgi:hypothetical protein